MTNIELSKNFYDSHVNYYQSSLFLYQLSNDFESKNVIYPASYLLRHSLELLLKSLICYYAEDQKIEINKDGIEIFSHSLSFKLEGHSLLDLYDRLIKITNNIVRLIEPNKNLRKMIVDITNIDKTSEYYRYPISKNIEVSKQNKYTVTSDEVVPDLSLNEDTFILTDGNVTFVIDDYDEKVDKKFQLMITIKDELIKYNRL